MKTNNSKTNESERETLEDVIIQMLAILNNIAEKHDRRFITERNTSPYGLAIVGINEDYNDWRGEFTVTEMVEELTEQIRRYTHSPRR